MSTQIIEETWKDIPNYEGIYQASSYGRIKSCARVIHYKNGKIIHRKERFLSLIKGFGQYLTVGLFKNNHHITYNVHYLIAITFIENPNSLPCINHKDENPTNNIVENLEWCTYKYNNNYGSFGEKHSTAYKNHPSFSKPVIQMTLDGTDIQEFPSIAEAARYLGKNYVNIAEFLREPNKRNHAYGYKWKYKNVIA